jgi:arylsulfatase
VTGNPFDPNTTWSDSTGWAWARNSPFKFYKQNQFEGGCATPAIVHWPKGLKTPKGSLNHEPAHLVDVLPTLVEVGGGRLPESWPDRDLTPVAGMSLAPVLAGGSLGARPPIFLQFGNDRGLRDGDWKLVSFRGYAWELYNLATDRTELRNLAQSEPSILKRLAATWDDMAKNVALLPGRMSAPVRDQAAVIADPQWTNFAEDPGTPGKRNKQKAKEAKR